MKEPLMEERERERERESVCVLFLPLFFFFLGCRLLVLELTRSSDLFLIWSLFGHSSSSPESTSSYPPVSLLEEGICTRCCTGATSPQIPDCSPHLASPSRCPRTSCCLLDLVTTSAVCPHTPSACLIHSPPARARAPASAPGSCRL